jgi:16S rRNA (cytosine1402-N4)-methyltransferase
MQHVTVLLREAVAALALTPQSVVIDATFGAGGHSQAIASRLGKGGTLLCIDTDPTAFAVGLPKSLATVYHAVGNFRQITDLATQHGLPPVHAILADLGWRSEQFAAGGKGFSFQVDEPLAMTFGEPDTYLFTAADIVNTWSEDSLADVIFGYGEERAARRIAAAIVAARAQAPIVTSGQLAQIVVTAVPPRRGARIHPATKTFQALRIAVNDELGALQDFLDGAWSLLAPQGRLSVITFHSLEDRIVKRQFRSWHTTGHGELLMKKPVVPVDEEIASNPRARSAKLRTISKL